MLSGGEKIYSATQKVHIERVQCVGVGHATTCAYAKYDTEYREYGASADTAREELCRVIEGDCQSKARVYGYAKADVCQKLGNPIITKIRN